MGRQIFICETKIVSRSDIPYGLCSSGMMIWYDGDGWGGACDPEYQTSIQYNNHSVFICKSKDEFRLLRLDSIKHRFLIQGAYSSTFTQDIADKIIKSIVIENYQPRSY